MENPFIDEITELPSDPIGGASGEKKIFQVTFIGKTNNHDFPFTVANEIVASQLGKAIGLNLPTVLTTSVDGKDCALVQFVGRDPQMNDPQPTAHALENYIDSHQLEIHGAIVFDLFVANNDRAFGPVRRNLLIDRNRKLMLYDNGNACFYRNRPSKRITAGIPRLDAVETDLASLFDMDHKKNHYWKLLKDWDMVKEWCGRICLLPDFLIESAVEQIPQRSASDRERARLCDFLQRRRNCLYSEIEKCKDRFSLS